MIRQRLPHANVFIFGMFARTSGVPKFCVSPTHLLSFVYQAYSQFNAHGFHLKRDTLLRTTKRVELRQELRPTAVVGFKFGNRCFKTTQRTTGKS